MPNKSCRKNNILFYFHCYLINLCVICTQLQFSEGFCVTPISYNRSKKWSDNEKAVMASTSVARRHVGLLKGQTFYSFRPSRQKLQELRVITTITSIPQFIQFVTQDKDDDQKQLCVIQYHARWCKVCRLVATKYKQIVSDYSSIITDDNTSITQPMVRFADVEVGQNSQLCKTLGITLFPYIEIYEGGIKVASFSTGASYKFSSLVRNSIREKLSMSKEEKLEFLHKHQDEISEASKRFSSLNLPTASE
jgi:thiol-disulfide isomerase/thioredoxin